MIDTHAHVSFRQFDEDRASVIARAREAGLLGWIEVGTTLEHSRQAVALAAQETGVRASVGVHPSDLAVLSEKDWEELAGLLKSPEVAAVGEVGFDFYSRPVKSGTKVTDMKGETKDTAEPSLTGAKNPDAPSVKVASEQPGAGTLYRGGSVQEQTPALERFAALAHEHTLPMIFHVRDGEENAHDALINFLKKIPSPQRPAGVVHTYSGTQEQAEEYLGLGLYLSFSGVVTFKNAGATAGVAKSIPLERLLIETDCPFLAPEPHRGKRNEPAYVALVAQKIAELRSLPVEEIQSATTENARRLFTFSI